MDTNKPSNTLAIIGLVLGSIAIAFSFIPCVGTIAFIPGIVGAILGVFAFLKAKDNGHPQGLSIAAIVVSVLACAISIFQIYTLKNMATDMKSDLKEYTSCEDVISDYKSVQKEMITITKEMEENNASLSNITKVAKLGFKLENIKENSDRLGCDINMDDFDIEKELEKIEAEENEGEDEATEAEEKGN